jgi:putative membrane protein
MPHRREGPWDPGLQLERTTLAWVRTTLSFVASGIVVVRLVAHSSIVLALVCVCAGLPLAIFIAWLALGRHRRATHRLHNDEPLPGGSLPAALAGLAIFVGCTGIIYVLTA